MLVFNFVVAVIFNELYTHFPLRRIISPQSIGEDLRPILQKPIEDEFGPNGTPWRSQGVFYMGPSNSPIRTYLAEAVDWLEKEGLLHAETTTAGHVECRLTMKALDILGSRPDGLGETLGQSVSEIVKSSATEARNATIGEVVGHIFGAAIKGLST